MTEYWKSNAKHFCDFCKCWTAGNKSSIEFHERGKNHQANVKKRLSEIKRNQIDKRKKDEASQKMFQKMEKAALAAAQNDIASRKDCLGKSDMKSIIDAQTNPNEKYNATYPWRAMAGPQGLTYYYNSLSGESTWKMPEIFKDIKEKDAKEKRDGGSTSTNDSTSKKSTKKVTKDPYRKPASPPTEPVEVRHVHPLLGGWSTVPQHPDDDDDVDDQDDAITKGKIVKQENDEHETSLVEEESTESRELGKKFKEKTLKISLARDNDEPTSFKKRKSVKRSVRKRDDDD